MFVLPYLLTKCDTRNEFGGKKQFKSQQSHSPKILFMVFIYVLSLSHLSVTTKCRKKRATCAAIMVKADDLMAES